MTDKQYESKCWLNRMYGVASHVESLKRKQEEVLASTSGIGKYEESFPGTDPKSTETKMLNYSEICSKIEQKLTVLHAEDMKTLDVIEHLDNEVEKAVLIDRYLNRMSWRKIAALHGYEERQIYRYHESALENVWRYVPRGEIIIKE